MEPASFMLDNVVRYEVEADCPEECKVSSHLDVDGTMEYDCRCEVSSAKECAKKYPGEGPRRTQHMRHRLLTQLELCKLESRAVCGHPHACNGGRKLPSDY